MDIDSKEISWVQAQASQLICKSACDLIQVILVASTPTLQVQIYDGESTSGDLILDVKETATVNLIFPHGMYMRRGIYFRNQTKTLSALFRFRPRPSKEG